MNKFEELTGIDYASLRDKEKNSLKEILSQHFKKFLHHTVVLMKVCGIDCKAHSLVEISRELGISPGRVQQIKSSAFRMLKNPSNKHKLLVAVGKEVEAPVKTPPYVLHKKIEDECKELFLQLSDKSAERDALSSKLKDNIVTFSIKFLDLSTRSSNCCIGENITNIAELIQRSEYDLLRIPNLGTRSLREISLKLELYGLSLHRGHSRVTE